MDWHAHRTATAFEFCTISHGQVRRHSVDAPHAPAAHIVSATKAATLENIVLLGTCSDSRDDPRVRLMVATSAVDELKGRACVSRHPVATVDLNIASEVCAPHNRTDRDARWFVWQRDGGGVPNHMVRFNIFLPPLETLHGIQTNWLFCVCE
jgi:hypothetical protein